MTKRTNSCYRMTMELYEQLRCTIRLTIKNFYAFEALKSKDHPLQGMTFDIAGGHSSIPQSQTENRALENLTYYDDIKKLEEALSFIPDDDDISHKDILDYIVSGKRWKKEYSDREKEIIKFRAEIFIYKFGIITMGKDRMLADKFLLEQRDYIKKKKGYTRRA